MIVLHAKVGTGPHKVIKVYYKRKMPIVGDCIEFNFISDDRRSLHQRGTITEIKDIRTVFLYYISLL